MSDDGAYVEGQTIYLLRHGDSSTDEVRRYVGRTDQPLNDTGIVQAMQWRTVFAPVALAGVWCSDLRRSADTARIIAEPHDLIPTTCPALREIDLGLWESKAMQDIRRECPDEYARRGSDIVGFRPPGGESFRDVAERVLPTLERVSEIAGDVLIVGHAGVNRVILCHVLGMPLADLLTLRQDFGCLNVLERTAAGLRILRVNAPAGSPLA